MGAAIRHFESQACTRCGGSGTYSWTQKWGPTCFKCGVRPYEPGTGFTLTKRGAEAYAAWQAANSESIPAGDVTPGARIVETNGQRWTVAEVKRGTFGSSTSRTGDADPIVTIYDLALVSRDGTHHVMSSASIVNLWTDRVALPPEIEPGTPRRDEMRAFVKAIAA